MNRNIMETLSQHLLEASRDVSEASSPHEVKQALVGIIRFLQEAASRIENDVAAEGAWSEEHSLHERALQDYYKLQKHLSAVATTLANEGHFVWMLRGRKDDLQAQRAYSATVGSMDRAMQSLIHLMQFEAAERMEVDIRKGFTFTSGSLSYGRMYF